MKNGDIDKPMDYFEKYYQTRPDGLNFHNHLLEYYFNKKDYQSFLLHYQNDLRELSSS